mmetsp:Transcript_46616/g.101212  ORF Transcript_46616/g.101212 Transcript_46616/m.101212 type:complete len:282 (+) Transcript_46616:203-1048(+)
MSPIWVSALGSTQWPGRCQPLWLGQQWDTLEDSASAAKACWLGTTLFLDGAHTQESALAAARWFGSASPRLVHATAMRRSPRLRPLDDTPVAPPEFSLGESPLLGAGGPSPVNASATRILLFNCTGEREPLPLLTTFSEVLSGLLGTSDGTTGLDMALFVPSDTNKQLRLGGDSAAKDTSWQEKQARAMLQVLRTRDGVVKGRAAATPEPDQVSREQLYAGVEVGLCEVRVVPALREAMDLIHKTMDEDSSVVHVFVTGSLYLVGDVLRLYQSRCPSMLDL